MSVGNSSRPAAERQNDMKKIAMCQNGQYRYSTAAKTIIEVVRMIKHYGVMHSNVGGVWSEVPVSATDKITGKIVGEI